MGELDHQEEIRIAIEALRQADGGLIAFKLDEGGFPFLPRTGSESTSVSPAS